MDFNKEKFEFEKSLELRNLEISLFWKRSWFFGALLLAAFTGYLTIHSEKNQSILPIFVSFLIMLISLFQSLMNRGSKYWQEKWKYYTQYIESKLEIDILTIEIPDNEIRTLIDQRISEKKENFLTKSRKLSVTKLTFLVWDIICLCSIMLWIYDISEVFSLQNINWCLTMKIIVFHLIIGIYIFIFWRKGSVFEDLKKTKHPGKK